jgi:hypothetical protein
LNVIQLFAQPGFGRDLAGLCLQTVAEGSDQWSATGLTGSQALAGRDATNVSFNGIDLGNAAQAFGGDL